MFDLDAWQEIFQTISKNKLRTFLSGLTITFAIFLFAILLGMGNGLKNTFAGFFVRDAENLISIWSWKTSKPYKGFKTGRKIELTMDTYDYIKDNYKGKYQHLTGRITKNVQGTYKNESANYRLLGSHPDVQYIEATKIIKGRFLNQLDMKNRNKVVVIGRMVEKDLFKKGVSAVGKYINLGNFAYKVIGTVSDEGGDNEERFIYTPLTTMQLIYGDKDPLSRIYLTYNPKMSINAAISFGLKLKRDLKERLNIAPKDQRGLGVQNNASNLKQTKQTSGALDMIVFLIGLGTLIAGIVGISNIMIYIVKERTKEIGIRKALGAKPSAIISMVMLESLLITAIAGLIGLLLGIGVLKLIGEDGLEDYFIKDPSVNTRIVIIATVLVVLAGLIAGYLPAKRASKIKPIVALRDE